MVKSLDSQMKKRRKYKEEEQELNAKRDHVPDAPKEDKSPIKLKPPTPKPIVDGRNKLKKQVLKQELDF